METIRRTVIKLLPPGELRERFETMTLDELRDLDLASPLWREVRAATGDPERRWLH